MAIDSAQLAGVYQLVTFRSFADDGEIREPFGADPIGQAIYTVGGWMSAVMMVADRPGFADGDILAATDAERLEAFATASAYAGRYRIESGQIVHELQVTSYPNWTGTEQYRDFELTDTHLTLFPPRMLMEGKMRRGEVRFERVEGRGKTGQDRPR